MYQSGPAFLCLKLRQKYGNAPAASDPDRLLSDSLMDALEYGSSRISSRWTLKGRTGTDLVECRRYRLCGLVFFAIETMLRIMVLARN